MKVNKRDLQPWMRQHPSLGRLFALGILLFYPLVITGILWMWYWKDVKNNFRNVVEVTFGKWEDG